ncbi:MAG: helix-turn-helix domain-containing protein [Lachnospiraceae bacterium]|nr:helix-turn-helix domain-containing protein [Lachnospiraceae bacterium]
MAKFCDLLYELRKEKNLTQSELAEKLGITNKAVSKWETGEAMPDTAQLLPLAEILDVSVDELLHGERKIAEEQPSEQNGEHAVHISNGRDTVDISSKGVYINGAKAKHRKPSFLGRISGCICASLMAVAVLTYILLGCFAGLWHPLWCIPASAALGCGVIGCTFDLFDPVNKEEKRKSGENPYTGPICGIVMCASLVGFLCVGAVCNLWNIIWVLPVAGACACMIIGTIGAVLNHKREK